MKTSDGDYVMTNWMFKTYSDYQKAARREEKNGRYDQAISIRKEAVDRWKDRDLAWLRLGQTLIQATANDHGHFDDQAHRAYQEAIRINPDNLIVLRELGRLWTKHLNDWDGAEKEAKEFFVSALKQTLDLRTGKVVLLNDDEGNPVLDIKTGQPRNIRLSVMTLTLLGDFYQRINDYDLARACFGHALRLSENSDDIAMRRLKEIEELSGRKYVPEDSNLLSVLD